MFSNLVVISLKYTLFLPLTYTKIYTEIHRYTLYTYTHTYTLTDVKMMK